VASELFSGEERWEPEVRFKRRIGDENPPISFASIKVHAIKPESLPIKGSNSSE
jgi:hypothetical protein